MAWVRYDDQFHMNLKVTAVIAEDAGAIALHVLANTWSNTQKRPGFIPAHQPGMLLCDKRKGTKWAALLVKHGLWHRRGDGCEQCREEYADLTTDVDGFVVHNAKEYRAPARDRTTAGTPSDLSEKRRQAGRSGGKASAAKREQAKRDAEAKQANGVSKTSNLSPAGVSPVVKASNEALTPDPEPGLFASPEANVPPSAGASAPRAARDSNGPNAGTVVAAWIEASEAVTGERPAGRLIAQVGRQARELLDEGKNPERLVEAAAGAGRKGFADIGRELLRMGTVAAAPGSPTPSRNSQILSAAMQRAVAAEQAAANQNQPPRGAISA